MEPIFGFILFGISAIVVSVVAGKRKGAGTGFLYLIAMFAVAFGLVVMTSNITHGNGMAAGIAAFLSPVMGLIIALTTATSERKAVVHGESGEYRKCPFCAEAIRREAVKCKHCGSDVPLVVEHGVLEKNDVSILEREFSAEDVWAGKDFNKNTISEISALAASGSGIEDPAVVAKLAQVKSYTNAKQYASFVGLVMKGIG
ncbi:DUF2545 family protein [Hafnia alvei]|uniref:DUF2545 family protein n=1 Tax=Hafnia alvei TaxID=569 RepID=UPI002DBDA48A|nr:DUF2545 family protein [Hafnia alvei]MEB7890969.1 DUF2545 family protein [Hafnia alvei]